MKVFKLFTNRYVFYVKFNILPAINGPFYVKPFHTVLLLCETQHYFASGYGYKHFNNMYCLICKPYM